LRYQVGFLYNGLLTFLTNYSLNRALEFYRRVLAVEINDALVDVAKENLTANGIQNAHILCFDSSYFANQILGKTTYYLDPFKKDRRTMKQTRSKANRFVSQEPIADDNTDRIIFRFNTVLVDPPRAGLDDKTIKAVQQYDNIIYISCFPPKLLQDINKVNFITTIISP
jgi:tRNA (uracil-5-)-methyltransferase